MSMNLKETIIKSDWNRQNKTKNVILKKSNFLFDTDNDLLEVLLIIQLSESFILLNNLHNKFGLNEHLSYFVTLHLYTNRH